MVDLKLVRDVSVVIPTIPVRTKMLTRAMQSVYNQTVMPADIIISIDEDRLGAPGNRDKGLAQVQTEWVAFLDDDDELYPEHIDSLYKYALKIDADLVYPWFDVGSGGTDPFPQWEGVAWDNLYPHQVPVTFLAKTEVVRACGGFSYQWDPSQGADPGVDPDGNRAGEDYRLILRMAQREYRIVHLNKRTWLWHHHGSNTSGLPGRW